MEQQFKVGDIVQVATMEKLPNDVRNWALDEELKLGIDYTVKSAENGWVVVHQYYHRESRFKLKTSNMELKTTKYKVLAEAAKCSTAKATLETLFPEAFEGGECIIHESNQKTNLVDDKNNSPILGFAKGIASWHGRPDLNNKCLWLDDRDYNWEMTEPNNGYRLLIPTRKTY